MTTPISADDDTRSTRRLILILAICGFASALSTRFADPMVGVIARDLAADPLKVALLSTAFALPYALIQPILGPIGDALGKERILKFLLLALALTLGAASFATDLQALLVLRVLSGAAAGGVIPLSLATIGDRVEMGERQVAIGRFLAAAISGGLLGGAGAGVLAEHVGWRGVFAVAAALSGLSAAAVTVGFGRAQAARGAFSLTVALQRYRRILGISRARALMLFVFVEGVLMFGILPYVAPLLEEARLGGAMEAGLIIGAFAVGGLLYTMLVRWLLRTLGLRRMLWTAGLICAAAFGALAPTLPWPAQAAAMGFAGLAFYMLHNSFQTQMTEVVQDARGSAVALHALFFFVGQALGPVVFGFLLAGTGRAGAMAFSAVGFAILGYVASRVFGSPQRPR